MQAVCAWCGTDLTGGPEQDPATPISHGICDDCAEFFLASRPEPLREFVERLDEPVLLVDRDAIVLAANSAARRVVGRGVGDVEGYRGGEVMECAYARLPGGCGRTEHCVACQVRLSVTHTFRTGRALHAATAYLDRHTPEGIRRVRLRISTECQNECVLLRLEEAEPAPDPPG